MCVQRRLLYFGIIPVRVDQKLSSSMPTVFLKIDPRVVISASLWAGRIRWCSVQVWWLTCDASCEQLLHCFSWLSCICHAAGCGVFSGGWISYLCSFVVLTQTRSTRDFCFQIWGNERGKALHPLLGFWVLLYNQRLNEVLLIQSKSRNSVLVHHQVVIKGALNSFLLCPVLVEYFSSFSITPSLYLIAGSWKNNRD